MTEDRYIVIDDTIERTSSEINKLLVFLHKYHKENNVRYTVILKMKKDHAFSDLTISNYGSLKFNTRLLALAYKVVVQGKSSQYVLKDKPGKPITRWEKFPTECGYCFDDE